MYIFLFIIFCSFFPFHFVFLLSSFLYEVVSNCSIKIFVGVTGLPPPYPRRKSPLRVAGDYPSSSSPRISGKGPSPPLLRGHTSADSTSHTSWCHRHHPQSSSSNTERHHSQKNSSSLTIAGSSLQSLKSKKGTPARSASPILPQSSHCYSFNLAGRATYPAITTDRMPRCPPTLTYSTNSSIGHVVTDYSRARQHRKKAKSVPSNTQTEVAGSSSTQRRTERSGEQIQPDPTSSAHKDALVELQNHATDFQCHSQQQQHHYQQRVRHQTLSESCTRPPKHNSPNDLDLHELDLSSGNEGNIVHFASTKTSNRSSEDKIQSTVLSLPSSSTGIKLDSKLPSILPLPPSQEESSVTDPSKNRLRQFIKQLGYRSCESMCVVFEGFQPFILFISK